MASVTRTVKKGSDTGRVDRDEVRAVTIALREGRTEDVVSGRVLREVRSARAGHVKLSNGAAVSSVKPGRASRSTAGGLAKAAR